MNRSGAALAAGVWIIAGLVAAQPEEKFKTRLSPVALDITMQASVAGTGSASAVLTGSKLSITGSFEGLRSPATVAHLHEGLATGVRGPAILDLTVSKATGGTIAGSFDLSAEQAESLKKGRLYIQISSEKAPDGNLWGWLLR
jgi:hypothetical protein